MDLKEFHRTIERNAIARHSGKFYGTELEVKKGDEAWMKHSMYGVIWCRVICVYTSGRLSNETHFSQRRAVIAIRGGERFDWDTSNLVRKI